MVDGVPRKCPSTKWTDITRGHWQAGVMELSKVQGKLHGAWGEQGLSTEPRERKTAKDEDKTGTAWLGGKTGDRR